MGMHGTPHVVHRFNYWLQPYMQLHPPVPAWIAADYALVCVQLGTSVMKATL